eukprot:6205986-Pleurochrysis_carterae.AAC.6
MCDELPKELFWHPSPSEILILAPEDLLGRTRTSLAILFGPRRASEERLVHFCHDEELSSSTSDELLALTCPPTTT